MKLNYPLLIILALALVVRLFFAFGWHEVWWDSGVYIGMGKYVYSAGENGLWEHIRPPLMPIILGLFWKIGLDPALIGRLFEIILMTGIVYLTYKLALHWWEEKTAIIASLIVALSPMFYYLSFHQYTEIPSTFLILLAVWLAVKEKHFWAGIAIGLAFLTKFYTGMFIVIILITLLLSKKWKQSAYAIAGFAIVTAPYFIFSWIAYGSPIATFLAAQDAISKALGCNVLRYKPWWQYGYWLIISETKLHILALLGIFALWKKWNKKYALFVLSLAIPALYLMQLHCRDYRYLTLLIPFTAMLTGLGTMWICDKTKIKKTGFIILAILLGLWMAHTSIQYYYGNEIQQPDLIAEEYFSYLQDKEIKGEIWTANPIVAAHTDAKIEKMYYPIYNTKLSQDFENYISTDKVGAVMLDNCGGGIICPPDDTECAARTEQMIKIIDENYSLVFDKQTGRCWYKIWVTS
ncbi:MAG: glycosyltransferase family 39 protein [Candidatus Woesearchaeota archaeon]|nr:glycosyltransferase family 39 protein [Candidatus Woesearchaeota archaeon]